MQPSAITKNLQKLGTYRLTTLLGFNGSIATYKGTDAKGREAAVVAVQQTAIRTPAVWEAACREAEQVRQHGPQGICGLQAFGHDSAHYWMAYDWLGGCHLGENVRNNGLPPVAESFEIMSLVAGAVGHLNNTGSVLRILNPASIFLAEGGDLKVLHAAWGGVICGIGSGLMEESLSSILPFCSPEVAQGKESDLAADVYSIGANLYFLLTGRPVFWSDDPKQLLRMILGAQPEFDELRDEIGAEHVEIIEEMLAKSPDDRPLNLPALAQRLLATSQAIASGDRGSRELNALAASLATPEAPVAPVTPQAPAYTPPVDDIIDTVRGVPPARPSSPSNPGAYYGPSTMEVPIGQAHLPPPDNQYAAFNPAAVAAAASQQQAVVTVFDEQVESARVRRNRILLMAISGGVLLLTIMALGLVTVLGLFKEEAPPAKKKPVGARGLQTQVVVQQQDVADYATTAARLKIIGTMATSYERQYGNWPSSSGDLDEFGATPDILVDTWGTEIDVRDYFIVSAGKNKTWDDDDDVWYDADAQEAGGYEPQVGLDTNNPILSGQGNRINDILRERAEQLRDSQDGSAP